MKFTDFNLHEKHEVNGHELVITAVLSGFGSGKKTVYTGTVDGITFVNADSCKLKKLLGFAKPVKPAPAPEPKPEPKPEPAPAPAPETTKHAKFDAVKFWALGKTPVYLYGPAGTGKNVLAEQLAKDLGLKFYYAGSLQQKYELEGFVDASGTYQETEFFRAFTKGGVFLFDEIDGTAAEVLVAFNAVLANGYYNFPKHGRLYAHPDFIVLAAGNTTGRGADSAYNGRYQLDASTLDRFAFVKLDYDKNIELKIAEGDSDLVDFIHELRRVITLQGLPYTASPRSIKRIKAGQRGNFPPHKVLEMALFGSWAPEDIQMVRNMMSRKADNMYFSLFDLVK